MAKFEYNAFGSSKKKMDLAELWKIDLSPDQLSSTSVAKLKHTDNVVGSETSETIPTDNRPSSFDKKQFFSQLTEDDINSFPFDMQRAIRQWKEDTSQLPILGTKDNAEPLLTEEDISSFPSYLQRAAKQIVDNLKPCPIIVVEEPSNPTLEPRIPLELSSDESVRAWQLDNLMLNLTKAEALQAMLTLTLGFVHDRYK